MAKGDTQSSTGQTEPKPAQMPQQNQYLQGNPATKPEANTLWMNPSGQSDTTGITGGGGVKQATSQPVQNGTMLGQITSGSVPSQAPLGFDQNKWADESQGTSNKYVAGRMAASGVPIDQIAAKVGAKVIAPDKIQYPDGFVADLYFDYGGPNQRVQYTDVTPQGQYQGNQQNQGMIGAGQNQQPNFLQQMFQQMLAQRSQAANQQFNPSGGQVPYGQRQTTDPNAPFYDPGVTGRGPGGLPFDGQLGGSPKGGAQMTDMGRPEMRM